jgi:hypothetical protein
MDNIDLLLLSFNLNMYLFTISCIVKHESYKSNLDALILICIQCLFELKVIQVYLRSFMNNKMLTR